METGLCTIQGGRIPLRGVEVTGELFGGHARVRVRQRYLNDEPTDRVPDADRISPPLADQIPYGLRLDLRVELANAKVTSPSHPISVSNERGQARVQLSSGEAALDRDVVLQVESSDREPLRS